MVTEVTRKELDQLNERYPDQNIGEEILEWTKSELNRGTEHYLILAVISEHMLTQLCYTAATITGISGLRPTIRSFTIMAKLAPKIYLDCLTFIDTLNDEDEDEEEQE